MTARFSRWSCLLVHAFCLLAMTGWIPAAAYASSTPSTCSVVHPLDPPDPRFSRRCPNCGMFQSRWARTWITFETADGAFEACSLHCLADMSRKSGRVPRRIKTAIYLDPGRWADAAKASFVVGSRAPGTMTMVSKIAFADREAAEGFVAECGGRATTWAEAYGMALSALEMENRAIRDRRIRKGKIVEPKDRIDECVVCGMYTARYPGHKAQVKTRSGKRLHFCSTQCLFKYLHDSSRYAGQGAGPAMVWVSDFESGAWISGYTAYYVVGSKKFGPMGYEAFAFDRRAVAESFRKQSGGEILPFERLRIERILSGK